MQNDFPRPPLSSINSTLSKSGEKILKNNTSSFESITSNNEFNNVFSVGQTVLNSRAATFSENSLSVNVSDYIENDNLIIRKLKNKNDNFDNIVLNLMFDITGNDYEYYPNHIIKLNAIANVKNNVKDSLYNNIENQFKSVLKNLNGYKYISDKITDKINYTSDLLELFNEGVLLRQDIVNNISYTKDFYDSVLLNKESTKFNKIVNNFIDSYLKAGLVNIDNESKHDFSFKFIDNSDKINIASINNRELTNHLMIDMTDFENISKPLDFNCIIIQNLINNARSLYTLMPGCISNITDEQTENFIVYKNRPEEVFLQEKSDITLWENININDKIDYINLSKNFNSSISDPDTDSISRAEMERLLQNYSPEITQEALQEVMTTVFSFGNNDAADTGSNNSSSGGVVSATVPEVTNQRLGSYFEEFKTKVLTRNKKNKNSENILEIFDFIEASVEQPEKFYIYNYPFNFWKESINNNGFFNTRKYVSYYEKAFELLTNKIKDSRDQYNSNLSSSSLNDDIKTLINKVLADEVITQKEKIELVDWFKEVNTASYANLVFVLNSAQSELARKLYNITGSDLLFLVNEENINGDVVIINEIQYSQGDIANKIRTLLGFLGGSNESSFTNLYYKKSPCFYVNGVYNDSYKDSSSNAYINKHFNEIEFKLKADAMIKDIKLSKLKSSNIDLKIYNDIIENIKNKNSSIKTQLIPYIKDDIDKISVLNSTNDFYKLLFTDIDEKEVQSNVSFSLPTKEINGIKYRSALKESTNNEVSNSVTSIFENYYPEGVFFSSTTFLREVIKNCKEYIEDFNNKISKNQVLSEILYLSFFNNNLNKDAKESERLEITKRFLFKAIQIDKNSSGSLKSIQPEKYTYDISIFNSFSSKVEKESVNLDSNSNTYDSDIRKIIRTKMIETYEEYKSSASSLHAIEKAIFNNKYLNSIRKEFNLSLVEVKGYEYFKIDHIFPFTHEFETNELQYEKRNNTIFSDSIIYPRLTYTKNGKVYFDEDSLNNIIDGKIINYISTNNKINESSTVDENLGFYIRDMFDVCCERSVFNKILGNMQTVLRTILPDYKNTRFDNEDDINSFIEGNKEIVEKCMQIIEIYSEVFTDVFKKIMFDFNIKLFENLYDINNNGDSGDFFIDKTRLNFSEYFNTIVNTMNISNNTNLFLISRQNEKELDYSVSKIFVDYYDDLLSNFEKNESNVFDYDKTTYKEKLYNSIKNLEDIFCKKMHDVIHSLKKSDFFQAVSFDMTRETIKAINDISSSMERVKNKNLLDVSARLDIPEDFLFKNIDNQYFYSMMYRNLSSVVERNDLLKKNVLDKLDAENNTKGLKESFNNIDIFETFKSENHYSSNINLNDDIVYAFDLPYKNLESLVDNIIVKITVLVKDTRNTNRMFLPIVRYFSPNIISLNSIVNTQNTHSIYIDFTDSFYNTFLFDENNAELVENLSDIVELKLQPRNTIQRDNFVQNIIMSHNNSYEICKMIYAKHDINMFRDNFKENKEFNALMQGISNNLASNIFGLTKDKISKKIVNYEKFDEILLMNENLNMLLSKERDINEITSIKSYDKYLITIGEKDLIYNDISARERYRNLTEFEFSGLNTYNKTSLYELNKTQRNFYTYRSFDEANINEREFLTFIVKTEII